MGKNFIFALNKTYYSSLGAYYIRILKAIELLYPGCKDLLSKTGLSIQAQDLYPHHIVIDQRGEQTINWDAKISGKLKKYYSSESSILKWTKIDHSSQSIRLS